MTTSVTKTIQIARPAAEAYAFISDPTTMPLWAIHNVRSIRPLGHGRWEMDTPRGKGGLVPRYEQTRGILDHDFIDAGEGRWSVSARIVPVGVSESVYMITLSKPDGMPAEAFVQGMKLMDEELAALKACIEARAPGTDATATPASVQVVQRLYDAFGRRDLATIFGLLSPDIEILQSAALPWGGVYRGHDGARQFFGKLGAHLNSTLSIERFIAAGDHVVVIGWTRGLVNANGAAYDVAIAHVWKLHDGLIAQAQFFIDHPSMLKALEA